VAVTAKAAAEVNEIARKHPKLKYGVMHQMRTAPKYVKAHQIIQSGQLGEIVRVQWTITTWFRSQAYYNSGSWRATWEGEGGGVLLNQCPHNLDILYWLTGQPKRITANLTLGKYHDIEVEDDVTAIFEYPNGATGVFITSTGEAPGTDYFEIVGDRGKLVIGKDLEFHETDVSTRIFIKNSGSKFGGIGVTRHVISPPDGGNHRIIHQNFVDAILDGDELIAPGVEGLCSLEMINAMIMSGLTHEPVDLPMDRDAYERLLQELVEQNRKVTRQNEPVSA
jgi:predicted dehydrogenase